MGYHTPWSPRFDAIQRDPEFLRYDRERFRSPPLANLGTMAVEEPRDTDRNLSAMNVHTLLQAGIWAPVETWHERVMDSEHVLTGMHSRGVIVYTPYQGRKGPMLARKARLSEVELKERIRYWREQFSCLPLRSR